MPGGNNCKWWFFRGSAWRGGSENLNLKRMKKKNRRSAISPGKFWSQRIGKVYRPVVPAGCHGRRFCVQDQHAPATVAEVEGDEICIGPGLVRDLSQRRRLRANECKLRSSV